MLSEPLHAMIVALPGVADWPELQALIQAGIERSRPDWELPLLACQAAGGDPNQALPGAIALVCMQRSIVLADDLLDEDPRGLHQQVGVGPAANLALALQAAALRVIEEADAGAEVRTAVVADLADMALATAYGQQLDVQNSADEASYWRVVRAKSTPFYASALHIGGLLAGATQDVAERLREAGRLLGEIVQLYDDLRDALAVPANPDWRQGRNNLLLCYALTADHPERETFRTLLAQVDDPDVLRQAQRILVRCGGVSYCAYHLIRRYQAAHRLLQETPLVDPAPLTTLFRRQLGPVLTLLKQNHAEIPPELGET